MSRSRVELRDRPSSNLETPIAESAFIFYNKKTMGFNHNALLLSFKFLCKIAKDKTTCDAQTRCECQQLAIVCKPCSSAHDCNLQNKYDSKTLTVTTC